LILRNSPLIPQYNPAGRIKNQISPVSMSQENYQSSDSDQGRSIRGGLHHLVSWKENSALSFLLQESYSYDSSICQEYLETEVVMLLTSSNVTVGHYPYHAREIIFTVRLLADFSARQ